MENEKIKIEFVKETRTSGDIIYFTKVNDTYISNTLSTDKEKAKSIFDNIVKNKGKYVTEEILETIEI